MTPYTTKDLTDALRAVNSIIAKCEKAQEKFPEGNSHHTLLRNRLKAMYIAKNLMEERLAEPPAVPLGLLRGTVALRPHDPTWETAARETADTLRGLFGAAAQDVQHVGSTSVPALHAKPILDLAVGMRDMHDVPAWVPQLTAHGFTFCGEDHPDQFLFVLGEAANTLRTHHIHVVAYGGDAWNDYLDFRDYLTARPDRAAAYDALKLALAAQFPQDRAAYTAGKAALIAQLLREAAAWRKEQTRQCEGRAPLTQ